MRSEEHGTDVAVANQSTSEAETLGARLRPSGIFSEAPAIAPVNPLLLKLMTRGMPFPPAKTFDLAWIKRFVSEGGLPETSEEVSDNGKE